MNITPHQAKYFAHSLAAQKIGDERLAESLFDAEIDLNPHQVDAALFALQNPIQEGVLLADEVGLGKTVEAGLVLCQMWAEGKRNLMVICPASLRKQWAAELREKFAMPSVVVDKAVLKPYSDGLSDLFAEKSGKTVFIMSYQFAAKAADDLAGVMWDCVALDEAHKLRNVYQRNNKTGQALKTALAGRKKLLLTATPLQNSLMELYGLSTLLDEYLFGDERVFRQRYVTEQHDEELKERLSGFVRRTLRKNVLEYIRYTERHAITQEFIPTDEEYAFYQGISAFLNREQSHAIPKAQRHLVGLILRKLLASSPAAVGNTLNKMQDRLQKMLADKQDRNLLAAIHENEDLVADWSEGSEDADNLPDEADAQLQKTGSADSESLKIEIAELEYLANWAGRLKTDSKADALLTALNEGFDKMAQLGAARKAIIFTESVLTQQYLYDFLSANGYRGKLVMFSGSNNTPHANEIYQRWLQDKPAAHKLSGSPHIDKRTALIDAFRDHAEIMIATEAAAEGVNLQFCSLLINYDLPWNPQRVEQRIGRCHRYGQKFDVVVMNFLNGRNEADKRVLELLTRKFRLFNGVLGASDEILGVIESGFDFERRIAAIYADCRTDQAIQTAFAGLQQELETKIAETLAETGRKLLANFDESVSGRLKIKGRNTQAKLDETSRCFWLLSRYALEGEAAFDEETKSFVLNGAANGTDAQEGRRYALPQSALKEAGFIHRIQTGLGQECIRQGLAADTPYVQLNFDYSHHPFKISMLEQQRGQSGWMRLDKLNIANAVQVEDKLILTACNDEGDDLDAEFCHKLLQLGATVSAHHSDPAPAILKLRAQKNAAAVLQASRLKNEALHKQEKLRLNRWADERMAAEHMAVDTTKKQLADLLRQQQQNSLLLEQAEREEETAKHLAAFRHTAETEGLSAALRMIPNWPAYVQEAGLGRMFFDFFKAALMQAAKGEGQEWQIVVTEGFSLLDSETFKTLLSAVDASGNKVRNIVDMSKGFRIKPSRLTPERLPETLRIIEGLVNPFEQEKEARSEKSEWEKMPAQPRSAVYLEKAEQLQQKQNRLDTLLRRQKFGIWEREEEIRRERDKLLEQLAHKLKQEDSYREIWTIRWKIE